MRKTPVLIIDRSALLRDLLTLGIERTADFEVVGSTGGSCRGVELCRRLKPDIVILDMRNPHVGGRELACTIRKQKPAPRVLALTDDTDAAVLARARECRVDGFLEKAQPLETLMEALRTLARGGTYFSPVFRHRESEQAIDPDAWQKILSRRQQQILGLVGEGLTSRAIAERLGLSVRTVETHRHQIMKRMEFRDLASMIRFAVDNGFTYDNCEPGRAPCPACAEADREPCSQCQPHETAAVKT